VQSVPSQPHQLLISVSLNGSVLLFEADCGQPVAVAVIAEVGWFAFRELVAVVRHGVSVQPQVPAVFLWAGSREFVIVNHLPHLMLVYSARTLDSTLFRRKSLLRSIDSTYEICHQVQNNQSGGHPRGLLTY
jgi:hypothetical protein